MGKRQFLIIVIAALVAVLAGSPPVVAQSDGPTRINESFALGDSGCQMNVEIEGDTIVSANLSPAFEPPPEPEGPVIYSFDFTGFISGWYDPSSLLPFVVTEFEPVHGTFLYAPSSFLVENRSATEAYYSPGDSTLAGIQISFDFSNQMFEFGSFISSSVFNNDTYVYDYYSFIGGVSPNPYFEINSLTNVGLFLQDIDGNALNGLNYPTSFTLEDWTVDKREFQVSVYYPGSGFSYIYGKLSTLVASEPFVAKGASPTVQQSTANCEETLTVEDITATVVCNDFDGDGLPDQIPDSDPTVYDCLQKTAVERPIMERSGDGSTYCYYVGRQRVCKTI